MKHGLLLILIIIMTICWILPGDGFAASRSVIVGFHGKPARSDRDLIIGSKGIIKRSYHLINAMAINIPETGLNKLKNSSRVAYIEEDVIYTAVEPLPAEESVNGWGVMHIGAYAAHASGNKGTGVKIAVIDTGIDYNHEDLDANYIGGYDFVFSDSDPFDDNRLKHGTHVSGIIAAEDNGIGVTGVAPESDIYALKVLDGAGFGLLSWVIAAIEWSVDNGMEIANMSLEGPDSQSLHSACDSAYSAGVLLVAAGGNTSGQGVRYPGGYDSVIAVTATDADDINAGFSPVGPQVELSAPGVSIFSTVAANNYSFLSGTSQASPHVAGTAALFTLSNFDDINGDETLNNKDTRLKLQMTAVDLGAAGRDSIYGYGLVNAAAAAFPEDCELCYCDSDNNSKVNIFDMINLKNEFGRENCDLNICMADFNKDNKIDMYDLMLLKTEYNVKLNCCLQI